ncbi:MAG: sigma 54-interacting transcriptional regulator [Candidatus Hydrogenedentes bacterium]|nr:sigma 54-interacting transcriptional regulator [Candidatus Hydrogenedentota bacterium]
MANASVLQQIPVELVRFPMNENLLGVSTAIKEVNQLIQRLAGTNLTALITGESGTGKDIVARLLHKLSPRYGKPFIKVNCAAIPESILESELFGYEKGAFTDARSSKPGRFELANHGTLFLDEIAETSVSVQSKLLQVFDGEPFMRIGGVTPVQTDLRIIAATNVPLADAVREGRMREDIFYRLSEVIVEMPPLRERPEDIPLLAEHFNYNLCKRLGKDYQSLSPDLVAQLQELRWPGNVRELASRIKKYVMTGESDTLFEEDESPLRELASHVQVPEPLREPAAVESSQKESVIRAKFLSLKEATRRAVESTERALIEEALRHTLWNRKKAAQLLDISYSSLLRRIEAYSIGKMEAE